MVAAPRGRHGFLVPDDVAYLNVANLAPVHEDVHRAGREALERRARPWDIDARDWFDDVEELRALVATLLGDDAENVALVPATSYGAATAAANLPLGRGDVVVVLDEEYPSGIYTWRRRVAEAGAELVTVRRDPRDSWGDAITAELDGIGDRVAVLSVPQVHWTDGAWVDLDVVVPRARGRGAAVVLDLSQSLGIVDTDVRGLDADFAFSVGYKWMLGPFGRSYLWVADRHLDGRPLEENWIVRRGAEDFAGLTDYEDRYQSGARRFDQGQRTAFETTPMAIAATRRLLSWGVEECRSRLAALTREIDDTCVGAGFEPIAGPRGPHVVAADLGGRDPDRLLDALRRHRCHASVRGGSLRLSPHLHVDASDLERLAAALAASGR